MNTLVPVNYLSNGSNLHWGHWILSTSPTWVTMFLLYMITIGSLFFIRDRCEGVYYNTSYSAMLGDGALLAAVLLAIEILKRGAIPPGWTGGPGFHCLAFIVSLSVGIAWWWLECERHTGDHPMQWADIWHHIVIATIFCYLGITLLPLVWSSGTLAEKSATILAILFWAALVVYDSKTNRLDQRKYRDLGAHLDAIRDHQPPKVIQFKE